MKPDRRAFLFSLASLAAAPPRFLVGGAAATEQLPGRALSDEEREVLGRFCEQLIPADDFPGALELGVADFIERVLREGHPEWVTVYRSGLKSTQETCLKLHQSSFVKLGSEQQIELMEKMERGDLPSELWQAPAASDFFAMVRSHAMQGFYSHPKWGGNRDKIAWKMIGYDDWWA